MANLPTNIDASYTDNSQDASTKLHQQHHDTIHQSVNSVGIIEGIEWEKFSANQSVNNDASEFPGTTITNWETTPNIPSFTGTMENEFNPTTGIFTPAIGGWYSISYQVQFAANATGYRRAECSIVHAVSHQLSVGGSNPTRLSGSGLTYLDPPSNPNGRFFTAKLVVFQTSGGPLNVTYAAFHIVRL